MRLVIKNWIKIVLFLGLTVVLYFFVTAVLKPKWNYPTYLDNISWSLQSFYEQPKKFFDVIFVGTSHCTFGISPMELYQRKGIISYNLGTSAQPVGATYYQLREAFKYQSPKVVVLDVSNLFFQNDSDVHWRYVLDEMPLARNKIYAAVDYANLNQIQSDDRKTVTIKDKMQRFNSVVFPLLQYHTRWESLNKTDFFDCVIEKKEEYFTNGYLLCSDMRSNGVTCEQMNDFANVMVGTHIWTIENQQGEISNIPHEAYLYGTSISECNMEWLKRIKELCEEHGAQLLLVKYPTIQYPQFYSAAWTALRSNYLKERAQTLGIPFLDLLYDVDLDININTDFRDEGRHLNYLGARKVSYYMADYLSSIYNIKPCRNKKMDEKLALYNRLANIALLELETDFSTYLEKLLEQEEDFLICIAVCDEMRASLTNDDFQALNALGLKMDESWSDEIRTSYFAVIDSGNVLCEKLSNGAIDYEIRLSDGDNLYIKSCGWNSGAVAQIQINGTDYACNQRGFNIVVMDKATGLVLDSVAFDTYLPEHTAIHKDSTIHLDEYWLRIKDEMR